MRSSQESRLLSLLNSPDNRNKCAECGSSYPTWASCNLGVFLCGKCASAHRTLGDDVSVVKSLTMDEWSSTELEFMESMGNRRNHKIWNNRNEPFPYDDMDKDAVIMFLRNKYVLGDFRTTPIGEDDYHLEVLDGSGRGRHRGGRSSRNRYDRYGDDYSDTRNDNSSHYSLPSLYSRSSRSSRDIELKLRHRSSTREEKTRYADVARKMKFDMGFEDLELNIEALCLTRGNIEQAADLVRKDNVTHISSETPPPLPKRRDTVTNSAPVSGSTTTESKSGNDSTYNWLDSDTTAKPATAPATMLQSSAASNQIYQYVDPNTGQYYYLDSNGQQYVDPNQQQQLQMQQTAAVLSPYINVQQTMTGQAIRPMMGQSTMSQPMMNQPMMGQPTMGQPTMSRPMMGQSTMSQPNMSQPTMVQPMMGQPNMSQPNMSQPMYSASQQAQQNQFTGF
ncbi:hypothetical protein FOA43_003665 [Brettanomyces nanus]|uniref:Arf-GAP domain-containing protein n=1 Tax=Eeniella nana TaxID=13502 RepID=A0A875S9G2_EENNA|nr:uncharacterized protein FOA43_003665 [Brettanomyces nanus]QPG76279.1 hypothetical protein FOA43_003665 [Brettanomyces nanus]